MYSICNQLKGLSQNTKNRIPSRSHTKSLIRSRINISGSINAAAADDYKKAMNFHEPSKQSLPTVEPIDPAAGGLSFSFRTGRPSQPFDACDTGDWFRPYEIQKRAALSLGFFTTDCHTCDCVVGIITVAVTGVIDSGKCEYLSSVVLENTRPRLSERVLIPAKL